MSGETPRPVLEVKNVTAGYAGMVALRRCSRLRWLLVIVSLSLDRMAPGNRPCRRFSVDSCRR